MLRGAKMGTMLRVTAKGQVTLRKELLRHLDVMPGDQVVVDFLPDGRAELRAVKPEGSIQKFT
jgi:antitoxin PrlF